MATVVGIGSSSQKYQGLWTLNQARIPQLGQSWAVGNALYEVLAMPPNTAVTPAADIAAAAGHWRLLVQGFDPASITQGVVFKGIFSPGVSQAVKPNEVWVSDDDNKPYRPKVAFTTSATPVAGANWVLHEFALQSSMDDAFSYLDYVFGVANANANSIGYLPGLNTVNKATLVAAINELYSFSFGSDNEVFGGWDNINNLPNVPTQAAGVYKKGTYFTLLKDAQVVSAPMLNNSQGTSDNAVYVSNTYGPLIALGSTVTGTNIPAGTTVLNGFSGGGNTIYYNLSRPVQLTAGTVLTFTPRFAPDQRAGDTSHWDGLKWVMRPGMPRVLALALALANLVSAGTATKSGLPLVFTEDAHYAPTDGNITINVAGARRGATLRVPLTSTLSLPSNCVIIGGQYKIGQNNIAFFHYIDAGTIDVNIVQRA
jgi:hypothetical protein